MPPSSQHSARCVFLWPLGDAEDVWISGEGAFPADDDGIRSQVTLRGIVFKIPYVQYSSRQTTSQNYRVVARTRTLSDAPARMLELLAWAVLLCLLFRVLAKLTDIYALIRPDAPAPPSLLMMPRLMLRKGMFTLYGALFLFLSKDKISKSQLARAPDADEIASRVDSEVRVIFIRHGESMWNLVFNRGFGPSFLLRLVRAVLMELYLIPFDDSCFLDSPLSDLGLEQCSSLQSFLRNPCLDPAAQADFDVLTAGEGRSVIVSSQLRRAAATAAIGLADRLRRTNEPILLHSSCQEISRNFDTISITEAGSGPTLRGSAELERRLHYDGAANKGNKTLSFRGLQRLQDFAGWAAKRPESTVIVAGHSLWFREFFKLYLPRGAEHTCKKRKIVNCGAVGFTLQTAGRAADGSLRHRIDPTSISVIYGGFAAK